MRVALIYPHRKKDFTGCNPPISLLYLASQLLRAGHDVAVIDRDDRDLSDVQIVNRLVEYSPNLVGMPIFSTNLASAFRLVNLIADAKADWKILLGGPHPSARASEVLEVFDKCDYVLRGEADRSIVDLVTCLETQGDLKSVKGLSYRADGAVVHNPDADLIRDVDDLPFPARDLLRDAYGRRTYWRIEHRGVTDVIITSRGCPFNCRFCFKVSNKFRARSPESILGELIDIRSRGVRNVHIMDDLFVWNKDRCLIVLDEIAKRNLNMHFKVRARADLIDEDLLSAMKKAGVTSVAFGIESGSQTVLDSMHKRVTVDMNYRAIKLTKKFGLQCYADAFLGFPGETPETIDETEKLLLDAKPTALNLSVMYPLPNTPVYDAAKAEGTLVGDWDVKGTRPWIKLPWMEDLKTLYKYRNRVHRRFLSNPVVAFNAAVFLIPRIGFAQLRILAGHYQRVILGK